MAFLKFGKKKEEEHSQMPNFDLPQEPSLGEQVHSMKQQGYTNGQIAQALQSQGNNPVDITNAINSANLGSNFPNAPEMGMPEYGQQPFDTYPDTQFDMQPSYPQQQGFSQNQQHSSLNEERIQEIAEAIIDEKWEEFAKDIKKVIEWKEKSEDRIAKIEQQMIDLRLTMDSLSKSIMGKITAYDQNIVDVGTEIKAMEKVFQKVLPTLTENVNKLERMAKDSRGSPIPKR